VRSHKGTGHLAEEEAELRTDIFGLAAINEDESRAPPTVVIASGDEEVPRMRIGVKNTVEKDHFDEGHDKDLCHVRRIEAHGPDALYIGDFHTLDQLQGPARICRR